MTLEEGPFILLEIWNISGNGGYFMQLSSRITTFLLSLCIVLPAVAIQTPQQQEKEQLKKLRLYTYLIDTGLSAVTNGVNAFSAALEYNLPYKLIPLYVTKNVATNLADDTITDLSRTGIARILGLKQANHKELVSWGVDFTKKGIQYRMNLNNAQTKGWLKWYLMFYASYFTRRMVTDLTYSAFVKTTGIDYPRFVKNNLFLYALVSDVALMASKTIIGKGIDCILHLATIGDSLLHNKKNIQRKS